MIIFSLEPLDRVWGHEHISAYHGHKTSEKNSVKGEGFQINYPEIQLHADEYKNRITKQLDHDNIANLNQFTVLTLKERFVFVKALYSPEHELQLQLTL